MVEEVWEGIPGFPNYQISNLGNVYNVSHRRRMQTSVTNHGHVKISLVDGWGFRSTRSVALIVAEAFVEPPDALSDCVVELDGNLTNVTAENLVWRPRWFAWKYVRQLKTNQARHLLNLEIVDLTTDKTYSSIMGAGMILGLLFDDIWESTYTGRPCYPTNSVFAVVQRV